MAQDNIFGDLIPGSAPVQAQTPRRGYIPGTPKAPAPPTQLQINADNRAAEDQARQAAKEARDTLEWNATHNPDGSKKPEASGDTKEQMRSANLDSIIGQINRVQDLYNQGIRDENLTNLFGALDSIGPAAGQFDAAGQAIADQGLAAFRVPGVGAQSDMEAKQFALANTPQSGNWDVAIEEKLRTMRARVDANRKAMGLPPAQWTGLDGTQPQQDDNRAAIAGAAADVPPSAPSGPTPPPLSDGGPQYQRATGDTREVSDPETQTQIDAMLRNGASYNEVNQYALSRGMERVSPQEYAAVRKYLRENPGYQGSLVNARKFVPLSAAEKAISAVGDNAAGAYFMGAGQFLSGNTLDNLASDPERARLAMDISQAQHGDATALGNVTGGIMAGMTGEAGLARLGMAPGLVRGTLADIAMGGANGAGMADQGGRVSGAIQGAATAGMGSVAGSAAMKGIGRAVSPSGGSLADLYAAGVRPTLGQRVVNANDGRGFTGMVGKAVNATEEALQSVPVVGSAIRGARQEARDQFQIGGFNDALKEIGEQLPKGMRPGTDPHKFAQQAFGRVYDQARSGMKMVADEELSNDLGNLAPDISALGPSAQNKLKAILANSVNNKLVNGELSGAAYKAAVSDLGKHIARNRKGLMADDQALADVLEGVQGALDASARRHSPEEAVALLDAADAGYSKLVRLEGAAARRGGDSGEFSPAQLDAEVQKASGGVRSKAYLRGDAMMQDYARAGRSLEDRIPNSGTPERMMAGGAIAGGAGYIEPTTLGILGAIGTAYAPGVRKVMQNAMAPGGPRAKAIANQLRKRARLVGAAGAASAVAALPGTAPSQ